MTFLGRRIKKAFSLLEKSTHQDRHENDHLEEVDPVEQFMKIDFSHFNWLKNYDFKTLIDVGANQGQFAYRIRTLFPQVLIYSFEPLPDLYDKLKQNFKDDNSFIAFNYALGAREDSTDMYLNEFSPSSSLLPLGEEHLKHFDFADKVKPVKIRMTTLDKICANLQIHAPALIKIDVQGFEDHVITGGNQTLRRCFLVIIEVSFKELYDNQPTFDTIYKKLLNLGFKYIGNFEQLLSPVDGEILQADALFLNMNQPS